MGLDPGIDLGSESLVGSAVMSRSPMVQDILGGLVVLKPRWMGQGPRSSESREAQATVS